MPTPAKRVTPNKLTRQLLPWALKKLPPSYHPLIHQYVENLRSRDPFKSGHMTMTEMMGRSTDLDEMRKIAFIGDFFCQGGYGIEAVMNGSLSLWNTTPLWETLPSYITDPEEMYRSWHRYWREQMTRLGLDKNTTPPDWKNL